MGNDFPILNPWWKAKKSPTRQSPSAYIASRLADGIKSSNESGQGYSSAGRSPIASVNVNSRTAPGAYEAALMQKNGSVPNTPTVSSPGAYEAAKMVDAQKQAMAAALSHGAGASSGKGTSPAVGTAATSTDVGADATAEDPYSIDALYQALLAKAKGFGADSIKGVDEAIAATQKNYAGSTKDIYDKYMESRQALDASAQGLGLNMNSGRASGPQPVGPNGIEGDKLYQYDETLRRLNENSDAAKTTDVQFLEKLKALKGSALSDTLMSIEQGQVDANLARQNMLLQLAAAKAGKGKGGGSGGSGSGSTTNKLTETSTLTEGLNSVGDTAIYDSLANDPAAQALYMNILNRGAGSDELKLAQQERNALSQAPSTYTSGGAILGGKPAANIKFQKTADAVAKAINGIYSSQQSGKKALYDKVIAAAMGNGGVLGNPTGKASNKSTGTATTKYPKTK